MDERQIEWKCEGNARGGERAYDDDNTAGVLCCIGRGQLLQEIAFSKEEQGSDTKLREQPKEL